MKKGILIISVGTSHLEALEQTVLCLCREIEKRFSDYACYAAFSNQHILKKMNEKGAGRYLGISEALEKMAADGMTEIIVQPANLLNGLETDRMSEQIEPMRERFTTLHISRPLFSGKEDYQKTLQAVLAEVSLQEQEALVLIGHGSSHLAASAYQNLEYTAYTTGHKNVLVGTLAEDKCKRMTLRKLELLGVKRICLMPLLFTAGYHAGKDIAADSNSWKSLLKDAGYEVRLHLCGLGELSGIRAIYMEHLEMAIMQTQKRGAE